MWLLALCFLAIAAHCAARPSPYNPKPFNSALHARQDSSNLSSSLQIDLGYEVYEGYLNDTSGLNTWKGIRFAAPPTGSNRFQAPQAPTSNRSGVIQASDYAPTCYQNGAGSTTFRPANQTLASEDCLFLNIWSPANATGPLPVLVWIHGGGYGAGSGRQDLSTVINTNNDSFMGVAIQYRLGAFGFMSSDEMYRNGVVNAGILDQHFALQWVQSYIGLFGGNASHVTIAGESAGGGSVMLQGMAYGGMLGNSLFTNIVSASPYLPMQYGYKDWIPTQSYYAYASRVGCPPDLPYGQHPQTIFECLLNVDEATMANASATISESGTYGTWKVTPSKIGSESTAFLPVTDGTFVQDLPSRQLLSKQVNGQNLLVGNNANEGPGFTPQNITTEDDLVAWLELTFPLFNNDDIAKVLLYYPASNASVDMNALEYATSGYTGETHVNVSSVGSGQQQRANAIYGETTFICPSYWHAEAYSDKGRSSYKYQFSVPPALHGADVNAYFRPPGGQVGPDFALAFQTIWGNFITTDNPSIDSSIAVGAANATSNSSSSSSSSTNPVSSWPPFTIYAPYQINLNQTGGTAFEAPQSPTQNITEYGEPGLSNDIGLFNAYTWEGGRGYRCDFWRSVGNIVPE